MNKRVFGLALIFIFLLLQNGHSQLPLQPRHTLKIFPGLFWNSVGYEFCPTAHIGIHISTGTGFVEGLPSNLTVLDLRWYPMKDGGKRFGESNRGILPYIGLYGSTIYMAYRGEDSPPDTYFLGPGLIAGFRLRLGKRPSIDFNAGGVPWFFIFDSDGRAAGKSTVLMPRIGLTFGWTLGLRQYK